MLHSALDQRSSSPYLYCLGLGYDVPPSSHRTSILSPQPHPSLEQWWRLFSTTFSSRLQAKMSNIYVEVGWAVLFENVTNLQCDQIDRIKARIMSTDSGWGTGWRWGCRTAKLERVNVKNRRGWFCNVWTGLLNSSSHCVYSAKPKRPRKLVLHIYI
jgi:hypothetical protein